MKRPPFLLIACVALGATHCSSSRVRPMRDLLGASIATFTDALPSGNAPKVWVHDMKDSECHREPTVRIEVSQGFLGLGGRPAPSAQPSSENPYDGLAFEVIVNHFAKSAKGRVIEPHRHNYATETAVNTRDKVEWVDEGKPRAVSIGEDLCLLDQAKKQSADKVLVYRVLQADEARGILLVHYRLSDVKTGVVEHARTLRLRNDQVADWSTESALPLPRR